MKRLILAAVVIVNVAMLFIVVPELSKRLTSFYNQDRFLDGYDLLADNVVHGNGYRFYTETSKTLMREPGYPLMLAGLEIFFGDSFSAVKVANLCLALLTAWLISRLVRPVSDNRTLAWLAPCLFLIHPGVLVAESRGGVEILFSALAVLFMVLLYRAMASNLGWDYLVCGLVLGLTVLVRSTPMLFPVFLLAYLLGVERAGRKRSVAFTNVGLLVLAMLAVLSPWIVRNYRLTGRFVPTASVLGVSAHAGQYICEHIAFDKQWVRLDHEASEERENLATSEGFKFEGGYYQTFYDAKDELRFSSFLGNRVMTRYREHPALCLKCMGYNLFNFWFAGKTWKSTGINVLLQVPYLLLGALGISTAFKHGQWKRIAPIVLFMGYVVAVYIPILAQARYSVPLIPFLSILAAVPLAEMGSPQSKGVPAARPIHTLETASRFHIATPEHCGTERR